MDPTPPPVAGHPLRDGRCGGPRGPLAAASRPRCPLCGAAEAFALVRTGETRAFGNLILRKGLAVPLAL
ncbi:RbsD/FucU domain-containing protein [Leifsonia sp. 2TAF2]|uniref:RbsD/FucU domain-containing protein n=1 Tax=Leifsonia sp. 2TAF2 TaxID=3233009 RepID=UPI003F9A1586